MIATTQPNLLYLLSEFKVYMESSRCQVDVEVPAGRCSFDCLYFVGDSSCRGTSCSWGDGRFYPPVENETKMTR